MSEPYVGEIRMFAGNFAPRGWALCDGQLLAVAQNDALFSLFGTIYGGDGVTTFGLPDMRGRVPIHAGQGPGLSPRQLGAKGGAEKVTLVPVQLPAHGHAYHAEGGPAMSRRPAGLAPAASRRPIYHDPVNDHVLENSSSMGGNRSHTNLQPFLCLTFIVALTGIYPSRT